MAKGRRRRWVVRDRSPSKAYWLILGDRPKRDDEGYWQLRNVVGCIDVGMFGRFFPRRYHLPPGGGPVLIEFKETT